MRFPVTTLIAILTILVLSASVEAADRRFRLFGRSNACDGPGCGAALSSPQPSKHVSVAPDAKKPAPKAEPPKVAAPTKVEVVSHKGLKNRLFSRSGRCGCR